MFENRGFQQRIKMRDELAAARHLRVGGSARGRSDIEV